MNNNQIANTERRFDESIFFLKWTVLIKFMRKQQSLHIWKSYGQKVIHRLRTLTSLVNIKPQFDS